ncbi:hypothetical protein RchiOBHm_Chr0c31g0501331 [Rosa chinensis]|uniref:Uncharacterized protein n=1 Tax=Rosa chinensis TaxID=74649 RepID=A0A2P6P709_ROSCH|nr:hypothetical protein RchiOBHm_Chr7g0198061 [Rosa chinensis]PRQ60862.1 hypothetical protein RchiOBHm_Chr0c31g0501331 [Rosa chinensis]
MMRFCKYSHEILELSIKHSKRKYFSSIAHFGSNELDLILACLMNQVTILSQIFIQASQCRLTTEFN